MTNLILLFGVLITLAGFLLLVRPGVLLGFMDSNRNKAWIHVMAVVTRVILGLLLISQSELSRFPAIIEVLGWISLVAAMILLFIGPGNFQRLMGWVLAKLRPYGRIGGLLSAVFGVFLIYAFIQ